MYKTIDYLFEINFPFFFDGVDVQMFSGACEITAGILLCSYCKWIIFISLGKVYEPWLLALQSNFCPIQWIQFVGHSSWNKM